MGRRFAAAWRFLTVFPAWPGPDGNEGEHLRRSAPLFPVVGLILGLFGGGLTILLGRILPGPVTAALAVAYLALVSGGLHLDGLADSADGLLSPGRDRDKALAVMRDSRIGSHGAFALVMILLVKYAALSTLPPYAMAFAIAVAPIAGRAAMLFPMTLLPYARESGLGGLFKLERSRFILAGACVWVAGVMAVFWGVVAALPGIAVWLGVVVGWVLFLRKRLGGGTGDTYGAVCELAEATVCVMATAAIHLSDPLVPLF